MVCDWPINYCSAPNSSAWESLPAAQRVLYEGAATEYLWRVTGRILGLCDVSIRPCRGDLPRPSTYEGSSGHHPVHGGARWTPVLVGGQWRNLACGGCGGVSCACPTLTRLHLPGPVAEVTAVVLGGVPLDSAAYRVDNRRTLVRQDGYDWPSSQNMSAPAGDPDTFVVDYRMGVPVPSGGQIAAGVLAVELFKAACNDSTCGLPRRVQTVTRQGTTIAMLDSFEGLSGGRTGIWIIDSWIASITEPPRRASVASPDVPRGNFRTG